LKGDVQGWGCDITEEAQIEDTFSKIDSLDILVANAGSGMPGSVLQMTAEHWDFVNSLNITGTALCIKHAGLAMKKTGGSIITLSSVAATRPSPWMSAYSATKAGVEMLTKTAAAELARFNIRVNSIAPGIIATEAVMTQLSEDFRTKTLEETLANRYGQPKDIAQIAAFLAGDGSTFITGQVFGIDGGLSLHLQDYEDLARTSYGDDLVDAIKSEDVTDFADKEVVPVSINEGVSPEDFAGTWITTAATPVGERKGTMVIKVDGQTFTGTSESEGDVLEILDGKIDGDHISWMSQLTKPIKMKIKGSMRLNGDELEGTLKLGLMGKSKITATRE